MVVVTKEILKLNRTENDFLITCDRKLEEISEQCEKGGNLKMVINRLQSALVDLLDYTQID